METEYLVHVHSARLSFPLASLMYVTPDPGAPHGGACTGCPFPSACNFVFNLSLSLCAPLQLYFFDTKVNRSYFLCEVQVAHPPVSQVSAALEGRTSSLSSLPAVLGARSIHGLLLVSGAILAPSVVKKLTSTKKPELNN